MTWSSGGLSSKLIVPARALGEVAAVLSLYAILAVPDQEQRVTMILNGRAVYTAAVRQGWQDLEFVLPAADWINGDNQLEFTYAYTFCPASIINGSQDFRILAVAFDNLNLELVK